VITRFRLLLCAPLVLFFAPADAADLEAGREINGVCAACHGDAGQGGKRGEYPRLAGQSVKYLTQQLKSFKARQRINIPMFPYTEERELPDKDIEDVAAYLSSIRLPTMPPPFKPTDDALTRLRKMESVLQIPRAEGDIEKGRVLYHKECAACHGKDGGGRGSFPALRGQYTVYLDRQAKLFIRGDRPHDEEKAGEGILNQVGADDIRDVLAYVSTLDD
jgi:cytochrome c553